MEASLGQRVVRGPDWEWGDQDGGEGFVGTVAGLEEGVGGVIVQWDMGERCRYRCGRDNKFDLRVLDCRPVYRPQEVKDTGSVSCDWCGEEGLVVCVWRCTRCLDYYLCNQCYVNDRHSIRHPFFRVPSTSKPKIRWRVSSRQEAERVGVRGIFGGARVTRGHDWRWGNQDGGMSGIVLAVKGWHNETKGSVVEVQWEGNHHKNVYRVGHKGKVDLKCLVAGEGGWYCPEHLPILGVKEEGGEEGECEFAAGDTVRVDLDLDSAKLLQEGHGGWTDGMNGCVRDVGRVMMVCDNGDLEVRYNNNSVFTFNPLILVKVDIPFHVRGTAVRVLDDMMKVHELQTTGPGWNNDIVLTLGLVGLVTKRTANGEIQATVNGQRWLYHPQCLQPVHNHLYSPNPDEADLDTVALVSVLTVLKSADPKDAFWYLAATGDVLTLESYLQRFPDEINRKIRGRTAVHVACSEGFIGCLRRLLCYQPDLEIMDENGLRPIHVCAYSNCAAAVRLLLEHGADINSKDSRENTATMEAAALGHYEVLKVLLEHRLLNIHAGDCIGSTALHCAVIAKRDMSLRLLLEAGADPSIPNYTASTPLHDAAATGYLASVERMVAYFPQHINIEKCDNGHIPLHTAVLCNKLDVARFLLSQPSCRIESRSSEKGYAPLHVAVSEGHTALVELLVGYGANVNTAVEDGSTPLLMVLTQKKMKPLSSDTPHLQQIDDSLVAGYEHGRGFELYFLVACMLVQEGADPHIRNRLGESPLQKCPSYLAPVIKLFAQKRGAYRGSLRSKMSTLPTNLKRMRSVPAEASSDPTAQEVLAGFPKHLKDDAKPGVPESAATPTGLSSTTGGGDSRRPEGHTPATSASTTATPATSSSSSTSTTATSRASATSSSSTATSATSSSSTATSATSSSSTATSATTTSATVSAGVKRDSEGGGGAGESGGGGGGREGVKGGGGERGRDGERVSGQTTTDTQSATPTSCQDSDDGLCCLCDKPVSAKLVPCGHTLMCRTCVGEARRCPKCFVKITGSIYLS